MRRVEILSAGCPACSDAIALICQIACSSCEVAILDANDPHLADRFRTLGIRSVPAVVVDGQLAVCCASGPTEMDLRRAGIGHPV